MKDIYFHIDCNPPKSTHQGSMRIMKRKGGAQFIGKFASSKGKKAQDELTAMFTPYTPSEPLQGALELNVLYAYPWRKAEKKANIAKGEMLCDKRPDCDNLSKMIQDILGKLQFYGDDGSIARLIFTKVWSSFPGITITITEINQ